ncbi:hypothetical protein PFTANZ_06427 [Plasmodium falciparum Tanzania (2000708)]|uniref:Duffy-binding-like domain-containing protein n=1 Tax=Plasmodium falciparum Tanzania (2000708) TaxID=1036725 RepID=A0A024VWP4_PLAFA|nr:hypothetical protein PFTANZ_06427 [Plasmodium falciparum Tanzania (2000708)]
MGGGNGGGTKDESAKHAFDRIGKIVQGIAYAEALKHRGNLEGFLNSATFREGRESVRTDAKLCKLNYKYHTNVTDGYGREHPCKDRWDIRFSDKYGGQCTNEKIHGNEEKERKDVGACAPFRRLHLCDQHLSHMKDDKIDNKHNLLLEVLLAAKYEGQSLVKKYNEYKETNTDSDFNICTALARSFADIGDIIRGKDLFRGYNEKDRNEKKQLQDSLKDIFAKIYEELKDGDGVKERYENDPNFFKLREDWWNANRAKVWKAIRCSAPTDADYFIKTACSAGTRPTQGKCRCVTNDVPTYFDYVPQYLRWFEEWAEDFCRKRKKQLTDAIKNCRYDEENKPKYCDLNGFDCEQTIRGKKKFVKGANCHDCSVTCIPFGPWIDNQKLEFEKQKNKYDKEILQKNERTITTTHGTINNMYVDVFYNKLQEHYPSVDDFLKLLSKEQICKDEPKVKEETAEAADFTKGKTKETFSHTEYCQACHWCGSQKGKEGKWEAKDETCEKIMVHNPDNITKIPILTHEEGKTDMLEKYIKLCLNGNNGNQIKEWQCHYEENEEDPSNYSDNCIQGDWQNVTQKEKIRPYVTFFSLWIDEMLEDSIKWREQLKKCINNKKGTKCISACKSKCDCYKNWVKHMRKEWDEIEKHFDKQKNLKGIMRNTTLNFYLQLYFKEKIEKAYGEGKWNMLIEELEKTEGYLVVGDTVHSQDAIKILLKHEKEIANTCVNNNPKDECKQQPNENLARSADTDDRPPPPPPDSDSEEDDEEEEEEEEEVNGEEPQKEVDVVEQKEDTTEKVCKIVEQALKTSLTDACTLKYVTGKNYGWRCIPSGDNTTTGSVCIPPRRRKLYIDKIKKWAEKQNTNKSQAEGNSVQAAQGSDTPDSASPSSNPRADDTAVSSETTSATSQSPKGDLLTAFVESAAVETFFAWHKYKMDRKPPPKEESGLQSALLPKAFGEKEEEISPDKKAQKELESGIIPEDFKRQMFYTLGDYRDICIGVKEDVIKALEASGDTKIKEISEKIDKILKQSGNNQSRGGLPNSVTTPQTWWDQNAQHIWNAMVCALTYKTDTSSGEKPTQDKDLKEKLFGKDGTSNEPIKYKYTEAKLDKDSGTEAKSNESPSPTSDTPTTLDSFIKRPTYFRYLEEWGQNFCKERTKRLKQIKEDCEVEENNGRGKQKIQKYSGDGEDCKDQLRDDPTTVPDFFCPECGKYCSSYRKWIERKKIEFTEQKKEYDKQKQHATSNNNGNEFSKTLKSRPEAKDFLQKLGPCSKNNNTEEDKIEFDENSETFKHTQYCDPCSEFKINCHNGNCFGDLTKGKCDGGKISADDIPSLGNSTVLEMRVSDNNTTGFDDLSVCAGAGIFEGIRKDEWKCGKVCGYVVCKPEKGNGEAKGKHIIQIRALVKRWVEYFFEDYNRIKHKISHCIKNGENKCINGCNKKCTCVEQWINLKKGEWENIKKRFNDQYKNDKSDDDNVRSFLEGLIPQIAVADVKNEVIKLSQFDNFCGCNYRANTTNGKDDAIDCMIKKLKDKIEECKQKHTPSDKECNETLAQTPDETLDDDIETEEAKKIVPTICKIEETKEPVVEEKCEEAKPPSTVPEAPKPEEEAPSGTPVPLPPPPPAVLRWH